MATIQDLIFLQKKRLEALVRNQQNFMSPSTSKSSKFVLEKRLEVFEKCYEEFHDTNQKISECSEHSEITQRNYFDLQINKLQVKLK